MTIRCQLSGHFYIEVDDNNPDVIEGKLLNYINALEDLVGDYMSINEYTWEGAEY